MPRIRFSLRTFFLFLFFACLIGSNIFTASRNKRLNQELNEKTQLIDKLQAELGHLVITDPKKLHAVAIPTYEALTWRWRLHVPTEGKYRIRLATHEIPENGIPTSPYAVDLKGGEYEFTAAIRKGGNDDWAMNMVFAEQLPSGGRSSLRHTSPMTPEDSKWAAEGSGSSTGQAGLFGTASVNRGETMELLRIRAMKKARGGSSSTVPEPSDGVIIWIEEEQVP
jgi:hypothetical protein